MRRAVKKTKVAIPEDRIIIAHLVILVVYTILSLAWWEVKTQIDRSDGTKRDAKLDFYESLLLTSSIISGEVCITVLLCMTVIFAKSDRNAKSKDVILDKQVPNIVYLMN